MTTRGVILEQAAPSTTQIDPDGGGANPPLMPETDAEQTMWQAASPWVHGLLGVVSFVPGLSVASGAVDAAIYTAEGNAVEASLAVASMIPGGKIVTTAGKAVRGAVGMARGTGAASRVVKGAHEAEEVVKAVRKADEAQGAARGAVRRKKEVTVKAREHKVPCFHPFDKKKFMQMSKDDQKGYLKEMAAQLKRQEGAINSLSAVEYKAARDAYGALGRNAAAAGAQERARQVMLEDITMSIAGSLSRGGMSAAKAEAQAETRAKAVMDKLAALHDPDMVAGGWMHPEPAGMGRADVNLSIGGSWNQGDRVSGMDHQADLAIDSGRGDQKMNIRLEPCRGKGLR